MTLLQSIFSESFPAATPILLAALGGLLTYHVNVLNIAMEGMLLIGAFFAAIFSYYFTSWEAGVIAAILGGMGTGAIMALLITTLKIDEFIIGITINILAVGGTTYMIRKLTGTTGAFAHKSITQVPTVNIPLIENIPIINSISGHSLLTYASILLSIYMYYQLYYTRVGIRLRAVGLEPKASSTAGILVNKYKVISILLSGALCGLGGAFLSIGYVALFTENMSAGRGWMSLVIIILTKGQPLSVLFVTILFGLVQGIGFSIQQFNIPPQFTDMLPYLFVLLLLYLYSSVYKKRKT